MPTIRRSAGFATSDATRASAHAANGKGRPSRAANRDGKGVAAAAMIDDPDVAKNKIAETYVKRQITRADPAGCTGHQGNSRVEIGEIRVV
ncbi:hypothetical protein [Burkholderia contaminans]|uniref:hypothetical protein n=1 Tax=Burkholderia contaminans TaxID=488447 RepID=UPI00163973C9|nr:hypothetical protein [Burkholderia contaminans]